MALLLAAPAAAAADGLPVVGVDGSAGVVSSDGQYRYVTLAGERNTTVARIHVSDGSVARHRSIRGYFMVPAVAYDRSTSGLSADGRTLVLIQPRTRLGQKHTRLVVLDAHRFRSERRLVLRGDFGFDAISPDGSRIFLVEYKSLGRHNFDPTQYAVRSLDLRSGKLDRAPIIDPTEPDERMGGLPVTRAQSADGRWAYTLYSGSEHPFVHALDTVGRTARCIDLDALRARDDLFQMRLQIAGGDLRVVKGDKPLLLVDTRTFAVAAPTRPAPPRPPAPHADGGEPPLWPWALGALALLLLIAGTARPLARSVRAR